MTLYGFPQYLPVNTVIVFHARIYHSVIFTVELFFPLSYRLEQGYTNPQLWIVFL